MRSIADSIGKAAVLDQLAEESAELAKAALKMSRILRGKNPTPVTPRAAEKNLVEEFTDVMVVAAELGLRKDEKVAELKRNRWHKRLEKKHDAKRKRRPQTSGEKKRSR